MILSRFYQRLENLLSLIRRLCVGWLLLTVTLVLLLRWLPPPTSAFMLDAQWSAYRADRADFELRYQWTDWENIAPAAKLAVIAAEDQLFSEHPGFDFEAMEKAWRRNQQGKRLRGASTLSQQTAKNLFLYAGRSYVRKGLEAYFTTLLEALWSKRRILEMYVNIAQFGDGIYGVEAASRRYFGKSAAAITDSEAALLAAVLPNPILLRVDQPSPYVRYRQRWIMRQMRQLGGSAYLDKFAYSNATTLTRAVPWIANALAAP